MTTIVKNKEKRSKRQKQTAEVFTPIPLVNDMLNKLPKEVWEENKTFLDPACGNGNFLVEILKRKLAQGHDSLKALKTIYGLDIMQDNIQECRYRLLKIVRDNLTKEHLRAVLINIKHISLNRDIRGQGHLPKDKRKKKWPNGSLDYDMKFRDGTKQKDIDEWWEKMQKVKEIKLNDIPNNVESKIDDEDESDIFDNFWD